MKTPRERQERQGRLEVLARRVRRAEAHLEALEASQSPEARRLEAGYLVLLQRAEEALVSAETLLLLAAREAYPLATQGLASQDILRKLVETIAPLSPPPTASAKKF